MSFLKIGENITFSVDDLQPIEAIQNDPVLSDRISKIASEHKRIAPKADDFVYFTAIMMHAAERALIDDDGNPRLDKKGQPITASWEINEKTGSWKWNCSDPSVKPLKNANGDIFPSQELKKVYKNWVGKPLCQDHNSSSMDGIRGMIIDTYWDERHQRIIALCALDKINFPDLARKVTAKYANSVSMGTAVGRSICFECGNVARTERDYCSHVKNRTAYGEINTELQPIELSLVVNGADSKAKVMEVLARTQYLENSIIKNSTKITVDNIKSIKEEFLKIADKIEEIEKELNDNNSIDNNFALTSVASNDIEVFSEIREIKNKMSQIEDSIKNLMVEKVSKEEFMNISKKSYFQGTEEPTLGKPQYEKEDADTVRNTLDKNMIVQDVGKVDGLFPGDLEKKKMLARAAIEERKAIRAAAVERAQQAIKSAYVQGTEEPKTYPVDPGQEATRKQETVTPSEGRDGLWGKDEELKKKINRASLKARLVKGASVSQNRWDIVSDDTIVLSATFEQLSGNRPAFYSQIGSNDFAKQLMRDVRTLGLAKTAEVYKLAQEAPAPVEEPAPAAEPVAPAAEEAAPELEPLPEALVENPEDAVSKSQLLAEEIEKLSDEVHEKAEDLEKGLNALVEQKPEEISNPEAEAQAAVSALENAERGANVVASLDKLRKVLHAGLITEFKKVIKQARKSRDELKLVQSHIVRKSSKNPELLDAIAEQSVADAKKILRKAKVLQASFIKFAHSSNAVVKQAALQNAINKTSQTMPTAQTMDKKPEEEKKTSTPTPAAPVPAPAAPVAPENKEQPKPEQKTAMDLSTVEGRREYRQKLAAAAKQKYSDMLQQAHPKSVAVENVQKTQETLVENQAEQHEKMLATVEHQPKAVKQAAQDLDTLIRAGRVEASRLDDLVKEGLDKSVVEYWKKYYQQTDGGAEFASALTKEYNDAKAKAKTAEDMQAYKAKYAKAYDLAYEMAAAGLISKTSSSIKDEAEKIVNYDDEAFSSMKRVVAHHAAKLAKTASVQVGVNYDNQRSAQEDTLVNQYLRAFNSPRKTFRG